MYIHVHMNANIQHNSRRRNLSIGLDKPPNAFSMKSTGPGHLPKSARIKHSKSQSKKWPVA